MAYTIRVKGHSRRRPVPERMKSLFESLGITDPKVTVSEHDRMYTAPRRRPSKRESGAARVDSKDIREDDE